MQNIKKGKILYFIFSLLQFIDTFVAIVFVCFIYTISITYNFITHNF